MRQQVVALAQLLRQRGVKPGDSVAVALPRSVFLTLALHGVFCATTSSADNG
ncbi:AMP-binding protein [Klebsiella pneumoniae]|uniref:AMP-binding protein n=1 Tax=Klebsiella pneumoniae TaxID=573 RepID=UPI0035AF41A2